MTLAELLRSALESLRAHALRSMLTALGIVFGVAAVITMLSIGEGARRQSLQEIQRLGVRNILVLDDPPTKTPATDDPETGRSRGLSRADARALASLSPWIETVVAQRDQELVARTGATSAEVRVVGTTPAWGVIHRVGLRSGRLLDALDEEAAARVCVIGLGLEREFFPLGGAVGATLEFGRTVWTVVGVLEHRLPSGAESNPRIDPDHEVLVPLRSALARLEASGRAELSALTLRVGRGAPINEVAALVARRLERRHDGVDDLRIVVPEALLRQQRRTQAIFEVVMGTIASISLLVGGIGIMNIMLASVLERTREIGIRRAVGARRRDILGQFLTEAVTVCLFGGVAGIGLGLLLTEMIARIAGWPTAISVPSVFLSFLVAVGVGIVFGYAPARRAAGLDPIECLRYE